MVHCVVVVVVTNCCNCLLSLLFVLILLLFVDLYVSVLLGQAMHMLTCLNVICGLK